MPLYEYECLKCGARFERLRQFSDPPVKSCPECSGKKVKQLVSSSSFHFKGSGWYATDYAKKSGSPDTAKPAGESTSEEKPAEKAGDKTEGKEKKPKKSKETTPAKS
jgi:putative FmdB family regulatory protein